MADVELSSDLREISSYAFYSCWELKELIIPEGVESIGEKAFSGSGLKTIYLPSSVRNIESKAIPTGATIFCYPGSAADIWAKANGFSEEKGNLVYLSASEISADDVAVIGSQDSQLISAIKSNLMTNTAVVNCSENGLFDATGESFATIDVNIKEMTITNGAATAVCFDVKPYDAMRSVIPNSQIQSMITLRLPVDPNAVFNEAKIYHNGRLMDIVAVQDDGNGNKFVEICTDSFSEFKYELCQTEIIHSGHSLNLSGKIGVDYYFQVDPKWENNPNVKLIFTVGTGDDAYTIEQSMSDRVVQTIGAKTYSMFTAYITSVEFTRTIKAQFYSGDEPISQAFEYSAVDYVNTVINGKYDEKLTALCKALANYCAYAQTYFSFHTDELANKNLENQDKVVSSVTAADVADAQMVMSGTMPTDFSFVGYTVDLRSGVRIYLLFKKLSPSVNLSDYSVQVNGKAVTLSDYVVGNTTYQCYVIPELASNKLATDQCIRVSDGVHTGNAVLSAVTYTHQVLSGTAPQALQDVVRAMKLYSDASLAYFQ